MSAFEETLSKSYASFGLMELDVLTAATKDNFTVIKIRNVLQEMWCSKGHFAVTKTENLTL